MVPIAIVVRLGDVSVLACGFRDESLYRVGLMQGSGDGPHRHFLPGCAAFLVSANKRLGG